MSATRTCPNCGAAATESERFCASCGSRLPEAAPPAVEPTIRLPETQAPGPEGSLRLPGAPAPQGGYGQPAPGLGATPPPARKGLPMWAIILIAVAGLCAIGCVATFAVTSIVGRRVIEEAATTVIAEATAQAFPTEDAFPTEAAEPTSTGFERPEATPTSAVVLSLPTKEPAGNTGTADDIFANATEAFRDEFSDNSNGWMTGQVGDNEVDKIEDGVFKVQWSAKEASYETYGDRDFTNLIADLDCKIAQGGTDGACGIIFAETSEVGYYRFQVYEDYYSLYMIKVGEDTPPLLEGDPSSLINAGDWNHLRVVRSGDEISIYLNDELLGTVNDSTYGTGYVGVSTASFAEGGGVEVWFDNFTIYELP